MKSLSELNSFANTSVTVTDSRPSRVIFDLVSPLEPQDRVFTVTSTTVVVVPTVNIEDIWNYATADVRYRVSIITSASNPLTSTISFPSYPAHMTLTSVGNVYTLSGFQNVEDWETVKSFTWNLEAAYSSRELWFLQIDIIYYSSLLAQDVETTWYAFDDIYYYQARLDSTFSLSMTALAPVIFLASSMSSSAAIEIIGSRVKGLQANLTTSASLTATGNVNVTILPVDINLTANVNRRIGIISNLSVVTSLTCNQTIVTLTNYTNRQFKSQAKNLIFTSDYYANTTPVIAVDSANSANPITIELVANNGYWSDNAYTAATATWSYTGSLTEVNNKFPIIRFYGLRNSIDFLGYLGYTYINSTATLNIYINGGLIKTKTINLTTTSRSDTITETVTHTNSSGVWPVFTPGFNGTSTIPNEIALYRKLFGSIIGSGGSASYQGIVSGNYQGSGGGGGEVLDFNFTSLVQVPVGTYNWSVGSGHSSAYPSTVAGTDGDNTVAYGYTARGGKKGLATSVGGASGNTLAGGPSPGGGGGGAGAAASGRNAGIGLILPSVTVGSGYTWPGPSSIDGSAGAGGRGMALGLSATGYSSNYGRGANANASSTSSGSGLVAIDFIHWWAGL